MCILRQLQLCNENNVWFVAAKKDSNEVDWFERDLSDFSDLDGSDREDSEGIHEHIATIVQTDKLATTHSGKFGRSYGFTEWAHEIDWCILYF